jgi:arsenate reductase
MKKATIYHNPKCSTSRKALAVLQESGIDFEIIEYLKNPPSQAELKRMAKGIGVEPVDLVRARDKRFKELGLSKKDDRSQEEWLRLMFENPSIIERPIVACGGKYAMGRPPESIREILS